MNLGSITLWGLIATLVLTTVLSAAQGMGISRMGIPFMVGTIFTGNRGRAELWGFLAHLANGWAFALVYALIFESIGRTSWWLGAVLGVLHGLVVLVALMPLLPNLHPRMASEHRGPEPTRALEPPGFLALNYGHRTPLVTIAAHLVYGTIIGAFYHLAGR
jgi:hypothetical protein